jgi:hypothetical protein
MFAWLFFGLTLLLEAPIWWWFHRKIRTPWVVLFFLLNLLTWPALQFCVAYTDVSIPMLEVGVVLVEGVGIGLLGSLSWRKAFLLSFLANALSYGIGEYLNTWL